MKTGLYEGLIVNALRHDGQELIGYIEKIESNHAQVLYACGDLIGWIPVVMIKEATIEEVAKFIKERAELGLIPIDQM